MRSDRDVVLVTGCSSGLGRAISLRLARQYHVLAGVRHEEDGVLLKAQSNGNLTPILLDVRNAMHIVHARDEVERTTEKRGLYGLINNAGIALVGPLELAGSEGVRETFTTNVLGTLDVINAMLPAIRIRKGRIINIGSPVVSCSYPFSASYTASKRALETISHALSFELHPWSVSVSFVEPGSIATAIWPKVRRSAEQTFGSGAGAIQSVYGERFDAGLRLVALLEKYSSSPQAVAARIEHLLSQRSLPVHVRIGWDAKLVWRFFRALSPQVELNLWRLVFRLMS